MCRREGACSNIFTSQAAKCEFLSKYQNHPSPTPNTSPVIREKEKSLNICFGKDIKLAGGAEGVPLPCTFQQLHVGA